MRVLLATDTTSNKRQRGIPRRALHICLEIGVPIVLLAAWFISSQRSSNPFFPPLAEILNRFHELWLFDHLHSDVVPSMSNLVLGFAIAVLLGVIGGVLLALMRPIAWLADPLIHFWRAVPPVALVPIFVATLGYGNETRLVSIVVAAVFPTLIATVDGLRSVDSGLRDVGRAYNLTFSERLLVVNLPAASPMIMAGVQISLQSAFVVMIASEMMGTSTGIGAMTLLAQQSYASADMWAGILLLGTIGYAANALFEMARARILSWYFKAQKQGAAS
ncbi:ABC transporter permease [Arthrobacter sp. CAU 1506]|uniref:ABC transporter permease n=1 Tax=Arthrobacter sp. CAU 1506 TaxID=2560052 RepID=UPI0010AC1641|nr:ABC transporter permease [Arthrobacter sp. CAU 1506]TJY66274.1 ABC transporter permease [Arthrobacter sp. CAU 1506]